MITETPEKTLATCTFCPKLCRAVCPVASVERSESVTPWGLVTARHLEEQGHATLEGEAAQVLYHCTGCRRCQQHCQDHVDVPHAVQSGRFKAFARGDAPARAQALAARMRENGSPSSVDLAAVARAAVDKEDVSPAAEHVLFPDCTTTAHYPELLRTHLQVVRAAGLQASLFVKNAVVCCGAPLYYAGDLEGLSAHARGVHKALKGRKTVVMASPGCAHLLRDVYPQLGLRWEGEILHTSEVLARGAAQLPWSDAPVQQPTVYQDPCHLARSLGVVEPPRALVARATGLRPREAFHHGAQSTCSGGGGGLPAILPEVAAQVAGAAVQALSPSPGEQIVTACPSCRRRLERAGAPAPVKDLSQVVAEALKVP